jgi:hypothetical protein
MNKTVASMNENDFCLRVEYAISTLYDMLALPQYNVIVTAIFIFFAFSVLLADSLCSTLRTLSYFLTRNEFSRKDAEKVWKMFRAQDGRLKWRHGPGRWDALLEELG